ncbi:MAG TPA: hypothetical protein P5511_10675, partial [Candidatus Goldiibacteriota bacterium]|nr:hypothetical protein [Candidatus Goldiibacteriota bacterium]
LADGYVLPAYVQTGGPIMATGLLRNGILYIGSTDGKMYTINTSTMGVINSYKANGPISTSAIYKSYAGYDRLYFADDNGQMYHCSGPDCGWCSGYSSHLHDYIVSAPAVTKNTVYVTYSGTIHALDENLNYIDGYNIWNPVQTAPVMMSDYDFLAADLAGNVTMYNIFYQYIEKRGITKQTGKSILSPVNFDPYSQRITAVNAGEQSEISEMHMMRSENLLPAYNVTPNPADVPKEGFAGGLSGNDQFFRIDESGNCIFYDRGTRQPVRTIEIGAKVNAAPAFINGLLVYDTEGKLHYWRQPTFTATRTPAGVPVYTFTATPSPTPDGPGMDL